MSAAASVNHQVCVCLSFLHVGALWKDMFCTLVPSKLELANAISISFVQVAVMLGHLILLPNHGRNCPFVNFDLSPLIVLNLQRHSVGKTCAV